MSEIHNTTARREETPVDDVRAVRERLSRQAGGDVRRLIAESHRAVEQYRATLGLKVVTRREVESKGSGS